jgi:hypothetical protein
MQVATGAFLRIACPSLSHGRVKNFSLSSARGSAKKLGQETTTVVQLSRHNISPKSVSTPERDATNKGELKIQRRDCLSGVVLSAVLLGFTEQAVALEMYEGSYMDPFHPDGWRVIMASGKKDTVLVAGVDQKDGEVWWTEAEVVGNVLQIDFSKKTNGKVGKLNAKPVNNGTGLSFPDGNTWKRFASKEASTADFAGTYSDPKHPEGWRMIAPTGLVSCDWPGDETLVVGVDDPARGSWWTKGALIHFRTLSTWFDPSPLMALP